MNGTRRSVVIVTIRSAVTSACFSFSIAQGPPMSASGWPPPMWSGPIWTVVVGGAWPPTRSRRCAHPARAEGGLDQVPRAPGRAYARWATCLGVAASCARVLQRGADEAGEERVRVPGPRPELGVELPGHEVRVLRNLDDLDELLLRPDARDAEPVLLELVDVVVVDLVPVAVTLLDDPRSVQARGQASLAEHDRVEAEPHRPAFVGDRALLGQEVDDVVGGARVEFRGVGAGQAADVARVLDHRALHPEADPEVRDT